MSERTIKEITREIAAAEATYRAAKFLPRERIRLSNLIFRLKAERAAKIGAKP